MNDQVAKLAAHVLGRAGDAPRYFVAIAGPPASGKSTLSELLLAELLAQRPGCAALVPMDGYHYDNAILTGQGLLPRKGAPETFDALGLISDLDRIGAASGPVAVPVFDRDLDLSRGSARLILPSHSIILVEGNYLLLDESPWNSIPFDFSISLPVEKDVLFERLVARWLGYGLSPEEARQRADGNDMVNAARVSANSRQADLNWPEGISALG